MIDITSSFKKQEEIIGGAETLDPERERIHRQMLSSVSHDLKTPLASIIGSLEVFERMKDKLPEDKQVTLINVALHEAYRLDNFITNILDMAKLDNGMVKTRREETEIGALLKNCMTRISNRLNGSTVNIQSNTPLNVITDPVLLSRVVCLILDNAVKYGGSPPVINVEFGKEDSGKAFINIDDNGRGVPTSHAEAIFSKYTRFAKEDQQNAGTGLGLAIGRSIMSLLGGDIRSSNLAGGGAQFSLHFSAQ